MPADEPSWWYQPQEGPISRALRPAASLWGWAARRRIERADPYHASLPVVCIGNFTAGGTGKTPFAIHVARLLMAAGERPAFLSRGYKGRFRAAHVVNPVLDTAADVGDEPMLLARVAPTVVSKDRAKAAVLIEAMAGQMPPTVIVMDDGLQNPSLAKDLSIAVVDGGRGVGNGQVIPAGPLRLPFDFQLGLADAILVNRPAAEAAGANAIAAGLRQRCSMPVLEAWVEPAGELDRVVGRRVLALSGIANPGRFFALLRAIGADVVECIVHPDHHAFTDADARLALARAKTLNASIVTTQKDWVRLAGGGGALAALRDSAFALPIELVLDDRDARRLSSLIEAALAANRTPTPTGPSESGPFRASRGSA